MDYSTDKLNLKRLKSGLITGLPGQAYVPKKMLKNFLEKGKEFIVIDRESGVDVTDEIRKPLVDALEKKNKKQKIKRYKKDNFPNLPEELIKKKLINTNSKIRNKEDFNFVDLFCGAGGLSVGLEQAGMKCILGTDINTYAMQSFRDYHKNAESYCGPISHLSEELLREKIGNKKVDLVCGGPPCQGFSTIGRGKENDPRNSLFEEFVRVVRILNPTYLLFENVSGLLATKNEKTLNAILTSFKALGYNLKIKVMESQHYGVPQKRKRTVILGCRHKYFFDFPAFEFDCIKENYYIRAANLGDVLEDISNDDGQVFNHQIDKAVPKEKLLLKRIQCIPEGRGIRYKKDEDEFLPNNLKLGLDWSTMREGRLRELRYFRLSRKLPTPTINTNNYQYYHPTEDRRFTVRELARIQTFPNSFKFFGNINVQKKLIGNAVPCLMGKALGLSILKSYNDKKVKHENYELDINLLRGKGFCYRDHFTDSA